MRDRSPTPFFRMLLGQTHVNGWSRAIASQNGGSTSYIFPFRLRISQQRRVSVRDHNPDPSFWILGQTHVNGWNHVISSQNGGSTDYISPLD